MRSNPALKRTASPPLSSALGAIEGAVTFQRRGVVAARARSTISQGVRPAGKCSGHGEISLTLRDESLLGKRRATYCIALLGQFLCG